MKKLIQNWPTMLVSTLLSFIVWFASNSFSNTKNEIDGKASIEYVKQESKALENRIEQTEKNQALIITMITKINTDIQDMRQENQSNFQEIRKQLYKN